MAVAFGRLIEFRTLALEFELVEPVGRIDSPFIVVEVEEELALVKVRLAKLAPSVLKEELLRLSTFPLLTVPFIVPPAKVGVAVVLIF